MKNLNFAFFGTDNFSVGVLDELKKTNFLPTLIIATPDKPKGRGLKLTSPPVKLWAIENKVAFLQPENFNRQLTINNLQLGIVASYGKIIPAKILTSFPKGMLNVHPSLLPKYRGASPIQAQILNDEKNIGVSIMLMDEKIDHGPLLTQREFSAQGGPASGWQIPNNIELSERLSAEGGKLLAETMPKWLAGKIKPIPQDEIMATFCPKINKEDGLIDLNGNPRQNFLKIQAFAGWPGTYFFVVRNGEKKRIKITKASFTDDKLKIESVIPEGKKEILYYQFINADKIDATIL